MICAVYTNFIIINIFEDEEFSRCRQVVAAKRKSLVQNGFGNKPNATRELTEEEQEKLFETGQFGDHDPLVLQRTLWWFLSLHFGFRARDESRKLCWGDVLLENGSRNRPRTPRLADEERIENTAREHGNWPQKTVLSETVFYWWCQMPSEILQNVREIQARGN